MAIGALSCKGQPDPTPWCSATPPPAAREAPETPTYYEHTRAVIDAKCASCHVRGGIGPLPLTTFEEVKAAAPLAVAAIGSHEMPPWLAARCCASYYRDYSLTAEERALLLRWFEQGAPAGEAVERDGATTRLGGLSRVDVTLAMPKPYTPAPKAGTSDDTRCFVLDWPLEHAAYVTGLNPVPGSRELVHHLVIGVVSGSDAVRAVERDQADDGPGYACVNPLGEYQNVRILGGGLVGGDYPRGIGTRVEPGSKVILDVHYSTAHAVAAPDTTSLQLRVDDAAVEAKPIVVTNLAWAVADGLGIDAGEKDAVFYYRYRPELFTRGKAVKLQSITPHMHEFATKVVVRRVTPSGRRECLLEIPKWTFGWEQPFWFADEISLDPDDELYLECHFDNSAENQPDGQSPRDIAWGGNNQDMCAAFLSFTE